VKRVPYSDEELATEDIEDLVIERELENVEFEVGDHVVYPHHGAGVVVKKEDKEILGEVREYLTIKILHNDMTVMVPSQNATKAGLRRVIDEDTVKKVLAVLADDVSDMPKSWNRRFKHNRDKIKTGNIYELAEVVRNLAVREQDKGLSTGEKQMFTRAKKILASELMYALGKTEDEAEAYLEEVLFGSSPDVFAPQVSGKRAEYTTERAMDPEQQHSARPRPETTPQPSEPIGDSAHLAASASPDDDAVRSEATERFRSLLARSKELGRTIEQDLAGLSLVGHSSRSDELSHVVRDHADRIERRGEAKSELAQRLRTRRPS
jgi:CarD family transcriptional regulator